MFGAYQLPYRMTEKLLTTATHAHACQRLIEILSMAQLKNRIINEIFLAIKSTYIFILL